MNSATMNTEKKQSVSAGAPRRGLEAPPPAWFVARQKRVSQTGQQAQTSAIVPVTASGAVPEALPHPATLPCIVPTGIPQKRVSRRSTKTYSREITLWEDITTFAHSPEGKGYAASVLLHAGVLVVLSLLVFSQYEPRQNLDPLVASAADDVAPVDEIIDTRADLLEGAEQELALIQPITEITEESEILVSEMQTDSFIQPESQGAGEQVTLDALPFAKPEAGKVVTKGNFSAWTVPADPAPLQNYLIIVQVKLPKSLKEYARGDLSGEVLGTDGYYQPITIFNPYEAQKLLPLQEGIAQLVLAVPGAVELVEDRIQIKSARLNEEQTLEIEF